MKLHPAIVPDYPAGVAAFRQLVIGAKPVFRAGSWDYYRREGYDHCYGRGLCLRHSNGETGKYETFTYVATPELLQWARDNLIYPPIRELLGRCGINERNEIRNWRRRDRYAQLQDRSKGFPSLRKSAPNDLLKIGPGVTVTEDGEVSSKGLTQWYVAEFCRINGLKGG